MFKYKISFFLEDSFKYYNYLKKKIDAGNYRVLHLNKCKCVFEKHYVTFFYRNILEVTKKQ